MESQNKAKLKSIVLDIRHILEGRYDDTGSWHPGDLEVRLAALGVRRDREALPLEQLSHLSAEDRCARLIVDVFVQSSLQSGRSREEAISEFLQEAAYTWANRLIALRCMEARTLIDEIIIQKENYGGRSLKHHRLTRQNPEVCAGEDDGLYAALCTEFAERAEELPLLFQPDEPVIALKPGVAALKKCIQLLSAADEIFTAPDALGWAYQYWNTEEKDRVFAKVRTVKGAKIEKSDIIPVTQLYTEPYMVKFLVQNSLGALWMAMHPDSRLCNDWAYYVRDADRAPMERKSLTYLSFLDPSVGSGHFLLEAFDLLFAMYEEEGELKTPGDICEAILSENLFGIDIDERAIQIAACALYMKAKEKDQTFRPTRINLAATNIHVGADMDHLAAFLDKHPEDKPFLTTLRMIFESLRHADELGTLLQIEEPVEKEFRFLKALDDEEKAGPPQQNMLFAEMDKSEQAPLPLGAISYEEWKSGLLARLYAHFKEEFASADFSSRFFGETAGKGLSLFDFLSRRYDVVATNPPYMGSKNMGPVVKRYVESHFTSGKRDLYAAFILRCLELARPETGRVAMVTQQSWMFLRSFADLRALDEEKLKKAKGFKGILRETSIETLAHLGEYAFQDSSAAGAFVVLFTLAKTPPKTDHRLTAFRLIGPKSPEEKDELLLKSITNGQIGIKPGVSQNSFLTIPYAQVVYWISGDLLEILHIETKLRDWDHPHNGLTTGNNIRFLIYFWEINNAQSRWFQYSKGGSYSKWCGNMNLTVDWENKGTRVKQTPSCCLRSDDRFFEKSLTYSLTARGRMGIRLLEGACFDNQSPPIFPGVDFLELAAICNSRISNFLLRLMSPSLIFNAGYVANLPIPCKKNEMPVVLKELANVCYNTKAILIQNQIEERSFLASPVEFNLFMYQAWLHSVEGFIDKYGFELFNLTENSIEIVIGETGTPAGWFPLIAGYDALPPLPEGLPDIPAEVLDFLHTHERRAPKTQELAAMKSRLRSLYEAGPGVKEETDNTEGDAPNDEDEESEQVTVGARIPIPAETFLEELSQKLEIHPISVYWLLKEGIEQGGWRCLPEEQRLTKDRFTVLILRLLGHRWPKQIEAGEPVPDWADDDGIIPLMEGTDNATLHARLRGRLAADYGDERVSSEENTFEEIMGKPLAEWVRKDFFRHHSGQFKKRPIAWHLSSARWASRPRQEAAFESLLYYQKTDGDLLPKLKNQYVIPLLKRLEMELRGLENANGGLTGEQETRKGLLRDRIQELKAFDVVLTTVSASGFGPDALRPRLRQYAVNDAMLSLKARWLKRLSGVIEKGPLADWRHQADETGLHADFSAWIADAVTHLDYHCAAVGPASPPEKTLDDDPSAKDLAVLICAESGALLTDALKCACKVWWKSFDAAILKPISEKIRDAKKELKLLKERPLDPKGDSKEQSDMKRKMNALKSDVKAWQQEMAVKFGRGQAVRVAIESWRCPEALTWETWLAEQAMYDQLSSLNGKRPPPQTVAEFIRQESLYQPDINDGGRVNIAPLQKAGLLTADILAGKDVDKAIADRSVWRDDERRWCREGKLPKPGWWE
ncbi:MAG: BREX-1 system adenine-specific DNA-methyltransferase PglX [Kiritimatiellia bacterium]|nr:BREX-1 system adenine-specific DNA-methyltransferase PglX [Kiritimatiellia bacterium]